MRSMEDNINNKNIKVKIHIIDQGIQTPRSLKYLIKKFKLDI